MQKKLIIPLPSARILKKIGVGCAAVLVFAGIISGINLYSKNQALNQQINAYRQNVATAQPTTATESLNSGTVVSRGKNIIPSVSTSDHVLGSSQAPFLIVQYADLECPFCKEFHDTTEQSLLQQYGAKVAFVWRDYPLTIHPNADMEAQIAECVSKVQGIAAFFPFIDTVFAKTESTGASFNQDQFVALAQGLGYDGAAINSCYTNGETKQLIKDTLASGTTAGVSGTPTTFIVRQSDGQTDMIVGAVPIGNFQQAIDDLSAANH